MWNMFNNLRFTDNVDDALQNAGIIALQYGSYTIDTEHILYGLSTIKDSVASRILSSYGVTPDALNSLFMKMNRGTSTIIATNVDLSIDSKEAISIATQFASQIGHDFVGTEHLLIALLMGDLYDSTSILKRNFRVNINDIRNNVLQIIKSNTMGTMNDSYSYGYGQTQDNYGGYNGYSQNYANMQNAEGIPDFIKTMGRDLTQKAREGKIDPIIGRQEELERVIEILCRKNKNNPVLIGEAGVGKSAVVDGLALAIAEGKVPEILKNKTIFSLELGGLMAGTKYRGELEERLKQLIDYLSK